MKKDSCLIAIIEGILTCLTGHATKRGFRFVYGRIPVDNAYAILRAVEKPRNAESDIQTAPVMQRSDATWGESE